MTIAAAAAVLPARPRRAVFDPDPAQRRRQADAGRSSAPSARVSGREWAGSAAAVFGRDIGRALNVARRIESGICHVNGPTVHDEAQMPFGGVKGSGIGRFGGRAGIAEFTDLRWVTVQTTPRHYPF